MSIISESSGEKTLQDKTERRLLEEEDDDDSVEDKNMTFSASVLSHNSKEIEFQLMFENAYLVSETFKYDVLELRVNKAYLFRSRDNYRTVRADCEQQNCFVDLRQVVPP